MPISGDRQRRLLLLIFVPCLIFVLTAQLHHLYEKAQSSLTDAEPASWVHRPSLLSVTADGGAAGARNQHTPYLHVLVIGSNPSVSLCRTLLSSTILGYPPPVLLDVVVTVDPEGDLTANTPDSAKIAAIHRHLQNNKRLSDQDLVLIVDGLDSWFQLPPKLMVGRYTRTREALDYWYSRDYGFTKNGSIYSHSIVGASSDACLSMKYRGASNTGCMYAPAPPPASVYEAAFDLNIHETRMSYISASAVMGSVGETRSMYARAASRLKRGDGSATTSGNLLTELHGEQEYARKMKLLAHQTSDKSVVDWVQEKVGITRPKPGNNSQVETPLPEGNYEFGIGLDYVSSLFRISTGSKAKINFNRHNNMFPGGRAGQKLPADVSSCSSPLLYALSVSQDQAIPSSQLHFNATLDTFPQNITWRELSLAEDHDIPSLPALLQLSDEKSHKIEHMWKQMWFHPWARALLRNAVRSTEGPEAVLPRAPGETLSTGNGKGGFWTQDEQWKDWGQVCGGFEDQLFGDGKGPWGKEGGVHPEYNAIGILISGEE